MDLTTIIFTFIVLILPTVYFLKIYILWKRKADIVNKIPGPKTYPLLGTAWDIIVPRTELFELFEKRVNEYRPFFRTWMGPLPEIHILKAEHMEPILSSSRMIEKGHIYDFLHPWLGQGLLTSGGSKWHSRRKLLTPAFHFSILEYFVSIFIEKSEILVNQNLKALANGQVFDVCPQITRCALDIICKTAMGVEINAMSKTNSDYVTAIYEISEIVTNRMLRPWLIPDAIFYRVNAGKRFKYCQSILHGFTTEVIQDRKSALKNANIKKEPDEEEVLGKKKRMAFLDLLLEASQKGANLSDSDIREEVDTFMFEGHDTTTASICWTLFLLGNYPVIQDKVFQELTEIFGNDDRSITIQDLSELKYLERVLKESLRLYPSVPFIVRQSTVPVKIAGYDIPTNTALVLHIRDIHRDPEYFPNPTEFDPDHFLPEACSKRHSFAYIPFSAGPRNCIGQKFALLEEKTILASILRKYEVKAVEKPSDIKHFTELILRSQSGIKLTMKPRR